jgi:hypothetical protein
MKEESVFLLLASKCVFTSKTFVFAFKSNKKCHIMGKWKSFQVKRKVFSIESNTLDVSNGTTCLAHKCV